ncbi:helix-turn-helix domain-containing protein [Roseimarinus sediminis]|uniref:helix-turn-helix domain-containing protein n=1 Tax=Roseimarinus sediminis TaxID=1610899 RepID=UPI003D21F479
MLETKKIGNKIAEARKRIGISQAELAQQLFISSQAVGKWERGESMPDIITLNRLAEIFEVDLNYFSENFQSAVGGSSSIETLENQSAELSDGKQKKNPAWDMSKLNLVDSDFSGLKNLHEKFSSSNMLHCQFIGSEMSGLLLKYNNVDQCDFSDSDLSKSHIQNSNLANNHFNNCLLKETEFKGTYIKNCDFTGADFTGAKVKSGGLEKNTLTNVLWNRTTFTDTYFGDLIFEGTLNECSFINCGFNKVKFLNVTLINTFFKNNKKMKQLEFIDCKADKLSYAFLKSNGARLTGITLLSE